MFIKVLDSDNKFINIAHADYIEDRKGMIFVSISGKEYLCSDEDVLPYLQQHMVIDDSGPKLAKVLTSLNEKLDRTIGIDRFAG